MKKEKIELLTDLSYQQPKRQGSCAARSQGKHRGYKAVNSLDEGYEADKHKEVC